MTPGNGKTAIEVRGLAKRFGDVEAGAMKQEKEKSGKGGGA